MDRFSEAALKYKNPEHDFFLKLINTLPDDKVIIKNNNGRLCYQYLINYPILSNNTFDLEREIVNAWHEMYHAMTKHISKLMMGKDYYFVIKMIPSVRENYNEPEYAMGSIYLVLDADITIAQAGQVVVNEWIYDNFTHKKIEWRCAGCSTPNKTKNRWCSQCGMPRALLIQEMMCINCGTPKNDHDNCCSQCGAEYSNDT